MDRPLSFSAFESQLSHCCSGHWLIMGFNLSIKLTMIASCEDIYIHNSPQSVSWIVMCITWESVFWYIFKNHGEKINCKHACHWLENMFSSDEVKLSITCQIIDKRIKTTSACSDLTSFPIILELCNITPLIFLFIFFTPSIYNIGMSYSSILIYNVH